MYLFVLAKCQLTPCIHTHRTISVYTLNDTSVGNVSITQNYTLKFLANIKSGITIGIIILTISCINILNLNNGNF